MEQMIRVSRRERFTLAWTTPRAMARCPAGQLILVFAMLGDLAAIERLGRPHQGAVRGRRQRPVYRAVIPFTAMPGPQPSARASRRSPHSTACVGVARAHRGPSATMPALPKRHRRERAKARSGLVGLHRVRPGHRGRDPPARDRTGTHPAMPGVPDRHRPPASRRAHLRRRRQKRALTALAQPAPPGTLTRGGP